MIIGNPLLNSKMSLTHKIMGKRWFLRKSIAILSHSICNQNGFGTPLAYLFLSL